MNMLSGLRPDRSCCVMHACLRGEQLAAAAASSERGLRGASLRRLYRAVYRPAWYEVRIVLIFIFVLRIVSY